MPLLEARKQYKPFEYPWAFDFWKRQQQIHWMPEEVPLGEDCRDWAQKLTDHERNLLAQIFRFFTQADVEVQDCYHEKYGRVVKPTEIKMMLTACAATQAPGRVEAVAHGFWLGLWHGFIFPVAFIGSLFVDNVALYAVPNNGGWYDFGYFLGIVVFGVGARKSHIVYRDRVRR